MVQQRSLTLRGEVAWGHVGLCSDSQNGLRIPPLRRDRQRVAIWPSGGATRTGLLASSDQGTRQTPTAFGWDARGIDRGYDPACREGADARGAGRHPFGRSAVRRHVGSLWRRWSRCEPIRTQHRSNPLISIRDTRTGDGNIASDISLARSQDDRPSRDSGARASSAACVSARQPRAWEGRSGEAIHRNRPHVPKTVKARSWRSQGQDGCAEPIRHQVVGNTALRSPGQGDER